MKKISIILPSYNRAHYIHDAISSVLKQSFSDFELIVVDDGSTDDTCDVVNSFDDPRIILISKAMNEGRSKARNSALRIAKGHFIAFLDSDDLYLPSKLEKQYNFLTAHPEIGMVYTSSKCIAEDGALLKAEYIANRSGKIYADIAFFRPVTITLPTVMVRREILEDVGNFDINLDRFEDTDMWRRLSKVTLIQALKEPTCLIRTHEGNVLEGQNPEIIIKNLNRYRAKVLVEDEAMGIYFLRRKFASLYFHYFKAFNSIPQWAEFAKRLQDQAQQDWPLIKYHFSLFEIRERVKSIFKWNFSGKAN